MYIINQLKSLEQFQQYVKGFNFGTFKPNKLVIHHTWRPTKNSWKGQESIDGLKSYYENVKRWYAGPHIFITEDGIWLFTPMNRKGIHAGIGNINSIGIEIVGDYDRVKWSGKTKKNALGAIRMLMEILDINTGGVNFHSDYSKKSCPGHSITKEWLFSELNIYFEPKTSYEKEIEESIEWVKENKISNGERPDDPITRKEIFVMLKRYHDLKK